MRIVRAAILLLLLVGPVLRAGDDIQAVSAVWSDFVSALRRGDYQAAHGLFSPQSRAAMPYAEFVREYNPLSAARELVLAKPESLSTRLDGDWAEINYGGVNPGSGRAFRVGVALVRNQGAWGLVAARNEEPERLEAGARGILARAAPWRDNPRVRAMLDELVAAGGNPVAARYRFEVADRTLRALPLVAGLRPFHVDVWGKVRPGVNSPAVPEPAVVDIVLPASTRVAASIPAPPLPTPGMDEPARPTTPPLLGGMPELSQPPPPPGLPPLPDDLPEPPPPYAGNAAAPSSVRGMSAPEPAPFALPDLIQ